MTRPLRAGDVMRELGTRRIGRVVHCHARVDSTNDTAFARAAAGEPEGAVVVAEEQTEGRGRQGRRWESPPGGLWCSVVLRPSFPPERRPFLTVLGAVAMARAIESVVSVTATIRWPNDVMLSGRKVAGVLVEVRDGPETGGVAILGIGCNVERAPGALPADEAERTTSIAEAAGRSVDRLALCRSLLQEIDRAYALVCADDTDALDAEWRTRSAVMDARVRVSIGSEACEGRVVALGALSGVTLETPDGATRAFRGEHITRLEML